MATTTQHGMADVMTMWTAIFLEVPAANLQRSCGMGQPHDVEAAVWKGYDAWARVAKATIDGVYKNPLFAGFAATTLDRTLRWQQWQQTVAGTIAASVGSLTGLPTAAMLDAMHEEIRSLAARLAEQGASLQELRAELQRQSADRLPPQETPHVGAALDLHVQAIPTARNGRRVITAS
jgi:hypothetical protein